MIKGIVIVNQTSGKITAGHKSVFMSLYFTKDTHLLLSSNMILN